MDTLQSTLATNGATLKEMGLDLTASTNLLAQFESTGVDASTALAGLKKHSKTQPQAERRCKRR